MIASESIITQNKEDCIFLIDSLINTSSFNDSSLVAFSKDKTIQLGNGDFNKKFSLKIKQTDKDMIAIKLYSRYYILDMKN